MKICIVYFLTFFLTLSAYGQKLSNKDVKRALESGKVSEINIITQDQFIPERNQEMDLKVTFQDGTTALASDYNVIWDKAVCTVSKAGVRAKKGLLSEGKGLIVPDVLSMYYPDGSITISVELAGKEMTKALSLNYCIENYMIVRQGINGSNGMSGVGSGGQGKKGEVGPDLEVQIEEETISSKIFMVVNLEGKKFLFDPECSTVQIISRGGNGGTGGKGESGSNRDSGPGGVGSNGGDGGQGGQGGTITVSGSALEKYKSKVTFLSEGGKGGNIGYGGRGGKGESSGSSGSSGSRGSAGNAGQVVFKSN